MIILLMGVAGSGKTAVGKLLAAELGWEFHDGDDYHPKENVDKMSRGVPLTDEDRWPWLARLHELMRGLNAASANGVIACSALKESYRKALRDGVADLHFVYLKGTFSTIERRMTKRRGHYMKAGMLQSQFDALEEPADAFTVDAALPLTDIVARIRTQFGI